MGLNLNKFDTADKANAGVWKDIIAPNGADVVAKFKIAGQDSKIMKKHQHMLAQKRKRKAKLSIADEEQQVFETYAACILDWEGITDDDSGEVQNYDFDLCVKILSDFPWILEQVVEFVGDRANFL